MKVFIIAAITADGFIGKDSDHLADWTSKEDKVLFTRLTKEAGVIVMGSSTFRTIGRALPGRRNLVYTSKPLDVPGVEVVSEPPAELIERLKDEGHDAVAICGGQAIYDLFLQAGVVDEVYLTIEPVIFGAGLSLFKSETNIRLKLLEQQLLNDNAILAHYEVVR